MFLIYIFSQPNLGSFLNYVINIYTVNNNVYLVRCFYLIKNNISKNKIFL